MKPQLIIITVYSLLLGTCSYQITHEFSRNTYKEAVDYYADKSCSKLSCDSPDIACMEYCYKKETKKGK